MALPQIGRQLPVESHRVLFSGPVLFIIYINDIYVGLNNFIAKFDDDTKLGNSVITDRDRMSLQEDLRKFSEWSQRWEMPFNANKYQILQVGTKNQKFEYEMNDTEFESVQCVRDLGFTIPSSLKFSQQCKDAAGKANRILGFINRNFSFKNKDVIVPRTAYQLSQTTSRICCAVLDISPC